MYIFRSLSICSSIRGLYSVVTLAYSNIFVYAKLPLQVVGQNNSPSFVLFTVPPLFNFFPGMGPVRSE